MKKFELITPDRSSPGAAGSSTKSSASKTQKKSKKISGSWTQNFQLRLDNNLRLAVPLWVGRIHADFAAFGGLPVVEGDVLWFNAWSAANLLEWTDTEKFGGLEPLRLRRLAVEAMQKQLAKMRSVGKKTQLSRAVADLAKARVGRYSKEKFVPREETMGRQIENGIELVP